MTWLSDTTDMTIGLVYRLQFIMTQQIIDPCDFLNYSIGKLQNFTLKQKVNRQDKEQDEHFMNQNNGSHLGNGSCWNPSVKYALLLTCLQLESC